VTTQQAQTVQQPQIIQLQAPSVQNQTQAATQGGIQIVQQIVTPTGEIQQIPVSCFVVNLLAKYLTAKIAISFMILKTFPDFRFN